MRKEKVLVFELGSSTLRAILAGRGLNGTFVVKAYKEIEYDGFYEGNFLAPEKLSALFSQIIAEFDCREEGIKKVYIGVPAEFSSVSATTVSLNLGNRRKIKQQDIDQLFYMASERAKDKNVEILSVNPLSYLLDEGRNSLVPVGDNAISISAQLSIIYADRSFIEMFNKIVSANDFESVEYSNCLFKGITAGNDRILSFSGVNYLTLADSSFINCKCSPGMILAFYHNYSVATVSLNFANLTVQNCESKYFTWFWTSTGYSAEFINDWGYDERDEITQTEAQEYAQILIQRILDNWYL